MKTFLLSAVALIVMPMVASADWKPQIYFPKDRGEKIFSASVQVESPENGVHCEISLKPSTPLTANVLGRPGLIEVTFWDKAQPYRESSRQTRVYDSHQYSLLKRLVHNITLTEGFDQRNNPGIISFYDLRPNDEKDVNSPLAYEGSIDLKPTSQMRDPQALINERGVMLMKSLCKSAILETGVDHFLDSKIMNELSQFN